MVSGRFGAMRKASLISRASVQVNICIEGRSKRGEARLLSSKISINITASCPIYPGDIPDNNDSPPRLSVSNLC
jgi:hypothetical protein